MYHPTTISNENITLVLSDGHYTLLVDTDQNPRQVLQAPLKSSVLNCATSQKKHFPKSNLCIPQENTTSVGKKINVARPTNIHNTDSFNSANQDFHTTGTCGDLDQPFRDVTLDALTCSARDNDLCQTCRKDSFETVHSNRNKT